MKVRILKRRTMGRRKKPKERKRRRNSQKISQKRNQKKIISQMTRKLRNPNPQRMN